MTTILRSVVKKSFNTKFQFNVLLFIPLLSLSILTYTSVTLRSVKALKECLLICICATA